jgi:energy-converting hydrogenase B subunit D
MNALTWTLDLLLAASLIGLAIQALASADLFRSIVLFIVFGLVMALTWARLNAPDIALVEAAIGAGLTGALMLSTYAALSKPAAVGVGSAVSGGDSEPGKNRSENR